MPKTIGVIGLGSIGMRHAHNLKTMGNTILGYDPNIDYIPHPFVIRSSVEEIIDVADAVVVASPTGEHNNHLLLARMHGKPTFVEKPIGHAALLPIQYDCVTMVGYNQRFNAAVKQAKQWLDEGEIGEPIWGSFSCSQYNNRPTYLRDGVILNWSHEIDLALYLLGPAKVAGSSTRLNTDGQDVMTDILLTHNRDIRTSIHLDYNTRPERRGFAIGGTRGWLSASLPDRTATVHREGKTTMRYADQEGSYDQDYKEEMAAFISRIDGETTIGCTASEAIEVLKICLEVRKQAGLV